MLYQSYEVRPFHLRKAANEKRCDRSVSMVERVFLCCMCVSVLKFSTLFLFIRCFSYLALSLSPVHPRCRACPSDQPLCGSWKSPRLFFFVWLGCWLNCGDRCKLKCAHQTRHGSTHQPRACVCRYGYASLAFCSCSLTSRRSPPLWRKVVKRASSPNMYMCISAFSYPQSSRRRYVHNRSHTAAEKGPLLLR